MSDPIRIYVASLSDYNAGRLHGVWIDLEGLEKDDVWMVINAMLKRSKEPIAEEFAIHDYEGFMGYSLHEYESIDSVVKIAEFLGEHGEAGASYLDNDSTRAQLEPSELEEAFIESYSGCWESEKDYAYDTVKELGFPNGGPRLDEDGLDSIYSYIDWEHVAQEFLMDGWSHRDSEGNVHIFRSY